MDSEKKRDSVKCPNQFCPSNEKKIGNNIVKRGKNRAGHQRYFCKFCSTWFVETSMTPLYYKHLNKTEILQILHLYVQRNSIRNISRITGHHRDTIARLIKELTNNINYTTTKFLYNFPEEHIMKDLINSWKQRTKRKQKIGSHR